MKIRVHSRTGAAVYTVDLAAADKRFRCDCLAGRYGRECWHIRAARRMMEMGLAGVES